MMEDDDDDLHASLAPPGEDNNNDEDDEDDEDEEEDDDEEESAAIAAHLSQMYTKAHPRPPPVAVAPPLPAGGAPRPSSCPTAPSLLPPSNSYSYPHPQPPNLSTYSFVPAGIHHGAPPAPFQVHHHTMGAPPPPRATNKKKPAGTKTTRTKTKPSTTKKQRGGQFDTKELRSFFNTMEKILPIGFREWELVLKEHCKEWSEKEREVRGLRQKFNRLNASKLPTGDPNCPWDVKWAKQLKRKIDEKADANLLNDVSEAEEEDHEEEKKKTKMMMTTNKPGTSTILPLPLMT